MRVPKVKHFSDNDHVSYVSIEKPITIPRLPVITNEVQRDKLTKTIETYIRTSLEYRDFIKYLKDYIDMNQCQFFHNISGTKKKGVLEIHHEPYDLYTITSIVMKRQEKVFGYINELRVVEEVMRLHYMGLVGLVPLAITAHELVHDGKLIVPLNCVYGRFTEFTKEYFDDIVDVNPYIITMLNDKIELTKKLTIDDLSILKVRYIYTNIEGCELPSVIEEEA